ncbi:amino acid ABC transporter permease [Granulicoccus sp. GXG6511]|uniref:amino acid ABC transporter permease n=1 Tax=Granulicoccus sp. GXG6511 TaxID=3381351 RepID=UPI003D7F1659
MSAEATVLFDAPGPRARRRHLLLTVVTLTVLVAALAAVIYGLRSQLTAEKWAPFAEASTWTMYIWPGLLGTLQAALIAVVLASILGVLLGAGRLSHKAWIRIPASIFVEFFRAVPVLIMMIFAWALFLFNGLLTGHILLLSSVVLGLTFYNASVIAELIRSGVHSLPRGQGEAGLAVGLTRGQTLTAIQLPQAIRAMLPSLVTQLVVVLKDSALGYMIGYSELLRAAQTLASVRSNLIVAFIVAGVVFVLLNYALTALAQWLEKRMSTRTSGRATAQPVAAEDNTTSLTP